MKIISTRKKVCLTKKETDAVYTTMKIFSLLSDNIATRELLVCGDGTTISLEKIDSTFDMFLELFDGDLTIENPNNKEEDEADEEYEKYEKEQEGIE